MALTIEAPEIEQRVREPFQEIDSRELELQIDRAVNRVREQRRQNAARA